MEKSGQTEVFFIKKAAAGGAFQALLPQQPPKGTANIINLHDISEKVNIYFSTLSEQKERDRNLPRYAG